jgi:hypothetical protein
VYFVVTVTLCGGGGGFGASGAGAAFCVIGGLGFGFGFGFVVCAEAGTAHANRNARAMRPGRERCIVDPSRTGNQRAESDDDGQEALLRPTIAALAFDAPVNRRLIASIIPRMDSPVAQDSRKH